MTGTDRVVNLNHWLGKPVLKSRQPLGHPDQARRCAAVLVPAPILGWSVRRKILEVNTAHNQRMGPMACQALTSGSSVVIGAGRRTPSRKRFSVCPSADNTYRVGRMMSQPGFKQRTALLRIPS